MKLAIVCTTRVCCSTVISGNIGSASTLGGRLLAGREVALAVAEVRAGTPAGAAASGSRSRSRSSRLEVLDQRVALAVGDADHVLVEDVPAMRPHRRPLQEARRGGAPRSARRSAAPPPAAARVQRSRCGSLTRSMAACSASRRAFQPRYLW